ncbi:MAG: hypothetical protein AAB221_13945, partial [Bacteroidota bacterium]
KVLGAVAMPLSFIFPPAVQKTFHQCHFHPSYHLSALLFFANFFLSNPKIRLHFMQYLMS